MLLLAALIVRGVSFEFRGKRDAPGWRATWSWTLDDRQRRCSRCCSASRWATCWPACRSTRTASSPGRSSTCSRRTGSSSASPCWRCRLLHGSTFLSLKTTGVVHERARRLGGRWRSWSPSSPWSCFASGRSRCPTGACVPGRCSSSPSSPIVAAAWWCATGSAGGPFAATAVAMAATVASIFVDLYPNVMVSSTDSAYNLTVANSASSDVRAEGDDCRRGGPGPLVLLYQGWTYYVSAARIQGPRGRCRRCRGRRRRRPDHQGRSPGHLSGVPPTG